MQEFIMLVGLPASGKSTVANEYMGKGYLIFSSDAIRKELFGDENDQTDNNLVFNTLHNRIRTAMKDGFSVVYDATNINAKRREGFLREMAKVNCHKHCVFMATPYSVCVMRNQKRERKVPMSAMERMRKGIDIPYYFEGWDEITVRRVKLVAPYEPFDLVDSLLNYNQENPHHEFTLGAHMKEAWRYAVNEEYNMYVQWAALVHDIGKPATKTFTKMNGTTDGSAHYYSHQNVGAYDSLFLNYPKEVTDKDKLHIAVLINYHMIPYTFGKGNIGKDKMRERLGDEIYNEVMQVHNCDVNAH